MVAGIAYWDWMLWFFKNFYKETLLPNGIASGVGAPRVELHGQSCALEYRWRACSPPSSIPPQQPLHKVVMKRWPTANQDESPHCLHKVRYPDPEFSSSLQKWKTKQNKTTVLFKLYSFVLSDRWTCERPAYQHPRSIPGGEGPEYVGMTLLAGWLLNRQQGLGWRGHWGSNGVVLS